MLELDGSILLPVLASWKAPTAAPERGSRAAKANSANLSLEEKDQVAVEGSLKPRDMFWGYGKKKKVLINVWVLVEGCSI